MPTETSAKPKDPDLPKLTVAQLKAICKERKISGYSKLGKQALIQRLTKNGSRQGDTPPTAASDVSRPAAPAATAIFAAVPSSTAPVPTDSNTFPSIASVNIKSSSRAESTPRGTTANAQVAAPKTKSKARKIAPVAKQATAKAPRPTPTATSLAGTPLSQADPVSSSREPVPLDISRPGNSLPEDSSTSGLSNASAVQTSSGISSSPSTCRAPSTLPGVPGSTSSSNSLQAGPQRERIKGKKRALSDNEVMPPPPPKKSRIQPPIPASREFVALPCTQVAAQTTAVSRRTSNAGDVSSPIRTVPKIANASGPAKASPVSTVPAKRFKPLVIGTAKFSPAARLAPASAISRTNATFQPKDVAFPLQYLDFPAPLSEVPVLRAITLPPPLAQRKRVTRWAVILSGLSGEERAVCALVSRTFRYAVYLSASSVLARDYRGGRLQDDVLKWYSQAMTNMWPYLRIREAEVVERRRMYEASFVPQLLQRYGLADPISRHLWASPDNPKQLVIAVRFALTRAWFELSVGISSGVKHDPTSWLHATIVDVQEVVKDEIWSVTLEHPQTRRRETLYAIEATCEVVGRPLKATAHDGDDVISLPVRADWSAYIVSRTALSSTEDTLLSHLKWACHEEFYRGMSTLWLKRVAGEGETGIAKRVVAERYVLACVVGNSISGTWLSTSDMAQDFAGLPARGVAPAPSKTKSPAVNLYLPEHHHVESVHFTSSGGGDLHPALATVQTPHREYYILRDNGMQVGCEEEGVAAVWQEVLGCDHRGVLT